MGAMLQARHLTAADFGGSALEGCNEYLNKTRPDVIEDVHRAYLAAGSDIIETNSFGGTSLVLAEYDVPNEATDLNRRAAQLARKVAEEFSTTAKPRFVAGSIGRTTKAITVTGGVTFPELVSYFHDQAKALVEGGADILLAETSQDTRNVKAALLGIERLGRALGYKNSDHGLRRHRTHGRHARRVERRDLPRLYLPRRSPLHRPQPRHRPRIHDGPHPKPLRNGFHAHLGYPNAGLPSEEGKYLETPQSLAEQLERFARNGWRNIVGGCCGATDRRIAAIVQMVEGKKPRRLRRARSRGGLKKAERGRRRLTTS
jgi:5-methyltetrahydrofolate--homocysteine methyltransferase